MKNDNFENAVKALLFGKKKSKYKPLPPAKAPDLKRKFKFSYDENDNPEIKEVLDDTERKE